MNLRFLNLLFAAMSLLAVTAPSHPPTWKGTVTVTIHVHAYDAATGDLIPDARVALPSPLKARHSGGALPALATSFPASGTATTTEVSVGTTAIRCEAPGFAPVEIRISGTGVLRFQTQPPFSVSIPALLKPN